jgi:hypothetical protein
MRLSEWRASAPARDAVGPKVAGVVDPILRSLGAEDDPHCWVAWGEEPANRFTVFVPTDPGLIACFVRVNVAGDGPRATTKLIRWGRVSIGELGVETQAGHRMLSFQLESQVLRGVDAEADRAAAFALRVIAAIDGRPLPPVEETRRGTGRAAAGARSGAGAARKSTARSAQTTATRGSAGKSTKSAGSTPSKPAGAVAVRAKASSDARR